MSRCAPRPAQYGVAELDEGQRRALRALIARMGQEGARRHLGVSETTLYQLRDGGRVRAETLARVVGKL